MCKTVGQAYEDDVTTGRRSGSAVHQAARLLIAVAAPIADNCALAAPSYRELAPPVFDGAGNSVRVAAVARAELLASDRVHRDGLTGRRHCRLELKPQA